MYTYMIDRLNSLFSRKIRLVYMCCDAHDWLHTHNIHIHCSQYKWQDSNTHITNQIIYKYNKYKYYSLKYALYIRTFTDTRTKAIRIHCIHLHRHRTSTNMVLYCKMILKGTCVMWREKSAQERIYLRVYEETGRFLVKEQ